MKLCRPTPSMVNCYFNLDYPSFDIATMMEKLRPHTSPNIPVMRTLLRGIDETGNPYERLEENIHEGYDGIINRVRKEVIVDGVKEIRYVKTSCIHSQITIFVESEQDEQARLAGTPNAKPYYYKAKMFESNGTIQVPGVKDLNFSDIDYLAAKLIELLFRVDGTVVTRRVDNSGNPTLNVITLNVIAGLMSGCYSVSLLDLKRFLMEQDCMFDHDLRICSRIERTTSGLEFDIEYIGPDEYHSGTQKKKPQKILIWQTGKYQLYRCMHEVARKEIINWISTMFIYLYYNTDIINNLDG